MRIIDIKKPENCLCDVVTIKKGKLETVLIADNCGGVYIFQAPRWKGEPQ